MSKGIASRLVMTLATTCALLIFIWPLIISNSAAGNSNLAQASFIVIMPILILILLVEFGSGKLNSKSLAMLGLLMALNAMIRLLGAGLAGVETAFFVIILGAYVFGVGFGFVLGAGSILASALLGAGVGPWLPFQMMAAGLVGVGGGWLGSLQVAKAIERVTLSAYALVSSFVYGGLMTMWTWPFLAGLHSSLSFTPGASIWLNLQRFLTYELLTGGLLWDLGRAATTVTLILLTGKPLLITLRRAANKVEIIVT